MLPMWKAAGCALLTGFVLATTAPAGELNPAHIPADAKWVIHVDYESLSDSGFMQKLRDRNPMLVRMIRDRLVQQYGIDLPEGMHSATLFSRDYRKYTGTVILQADYDAAKVEAKLKKATKYSVTQWQDHALHTVTLSKQKPGDPDPSGDQEMTVVMVDDDTLLLASSVPNAQAALKLLAGESPSLEGQKSPLLSDSAKQAWIYGAAIDLGNLRQHDVSMPVLAQHEKIVWAVGKRNDKLFEEATFTGQSEPVAEKMQRVLDGLLAYGQLWASDSKPLTELYRDIEITREGSTTGFRWQGDADQVATALDDVFNRVDTWKDLLIR